MAKIQRIKSARKEHKCSKCGNIINIGDTYLKSEIGFGPTIIRCTNCGLKPYEATTSDYTLQVGRIVYDWSDDFEIGDSIFEDLSNALQSILDEVQERLENMPESLQYGPTGEMLQERIDNLESAISSLDELSVDEIKDEIAYDMVDEDYDEAIQVILSTQEDGSKVVAELNDAVKEAISEAIESVLSEIEV